MSSKHHFVSIVGCSHVIEAIRALMEQAINSNTDVLITGETGTGKELVAKEIHYNSPRKESPLLACNCGAGSRELIASELFGHRKGAFTGATQHRPGIFEIAKGGTVILDEIGDMALELQLDLLCVLAGRKIQRIGEYKSRDVNVRVIAISNRDLAKEVETGRFRGDLYRCLKEFHIIVPPLRERLGDIPLLAKHFYQESCRQMLSDLDGFAPDVLEMLQSYPWPGNVRELRNEIYQACALVETGISIQTHHFPSQIFAEYINSGHDSGK
jgi:transcriptional regulator with GAF, ATPase, and Fis domain